jgi:hypothetical protein
MGTSESDNFLIIKSVWTVSFSSGGSPQKTDSPHAVEDVPEMVVTLSSIWKTTVGGDILFKSINAPGSPWNLGTSSFLWRTCENAIHRSFVMTTYLNSGYTAKSPEVTITDPGELLLDRFKNSTGDSQTIVCTMQRFRVESHSSVVTI